MLMVALMVMCAVSWADDITTDDLDDPATLHTGTGAGTSCATGGCYVKGGEVNGFTGNTIDIYQNSASASTLNNPWLLILGVPNANNPALFSNASIGSVVSTNVYPGGTTTTGSAAFGNGGNPIYGWSGNGYAGSMTSGDVYHQSFFTNGHLSGNGIDASNSFGNWAGWDAAVNGVNATSFGIYIFTINAPLSGQGLTNITFADGVVPQGTFVVAYGNDGSHVYVNPFTEAGLSETTTTPEPASLALLGSGMLGLGGLVRKKLRK